MKGGQRLEVIPKTSAGSAERPLGVPGVGIAIGRAFRGRLQVDCGALC